MSLQKEYIHISKYARWIPKENRRETWEETVDRYINHVVYPVLEKCKVDEISLAESLREAIMNHEVMPSMRALMTAGLAMDRDHMAGYNCAFMNVDDVRAFDEALYILCCGTGLGFSNEAHIIAKLPEVAEEFHATDSTVVVADSKLGWASALRELLGFLYAGKIPKVDVSKVRGKGERLKTFGGRASGPEPLVDLFNYCVSIFRNAAGRKLNDIEVHGIMCKIGDIVVVGGVRRSAEIGLSDLKSRAMATAKTGQWYIAHPEYALANNSAVFTEKPSVAEMMDFWKDLYESKSGERGIYNRQGIRTKTDIIGRRESSLIAGTNPCGEIALRSAGLCNLTEVVVRSGDDVDSLKRKARLATILGTIQSTYTDFRYVRNIWKRNAEEERLLGVSLTGIYDSALLSGSGGNLSQVLEELKEYCGEVNREFAEKLGITASVAVSTVKPSGTVSQLVDSASGIHPRHAPFYIRSYRQDNKDPLTQFMKHVGIPNEPCMMKPDSTTIFFFPVKAPEGTKTRDDVTALDHLELWKIYNEHWAEHQVSITVSLKESEWLPVGAWVHENFDHLSGVSFLPHDGGSYRQAPYTACSESDYLSLLDRMPAEVDWSGLREFEKEDMTTSAREYACVGNSCEVTW